MQDNYGDETKRAAAAETSGADHDASGVGERAAREAAARFLAEGRCVRIAVPPRLGSDFNDLLNGRTHKERHHDAA